VTANGQKRDAQGGEVVGEEGAFVAAGCNGNDAAESGGGVNEGEKVGDKAGAGVEC